MRGYTAVRDSGEGVDRICRSAGGLVVAEGDLHQPASVGNYRAFTVADRAHAMTTASAARTGVAVWREVRRLPVPDPRERQPDHTQTQALLICRARGQLAEGLGLSPGHFAAEPLAANWVGAQPRPHGSEAPRLRSSLPGIAIFVIGISSLS
jgi:hypothetical protein